MPNTLTGVTFLVETIEFWPNLAVVSTEIICPSVYCPKVWKVFNYWETIYDMCLALFNFIGPSWEKLEHLKVYDGSFKFVTKISSETKVNVSNSDSGSIIIFLTTKHFAAKKTFMIWKGDAIMFKKFIDTYYSCESELEVEVENEGWVSICLHFEIPWEFLRIWINSLCTS